MTTPAEDARGVDPVAIPRLSLALGFGPMVVIVLLGVGALASTGLSRSGALLLGGGWAAAILIFVSGVRRGYGFARQATPRPTTLLATMAMFACALAALLLLLLLRPWLAMAVLILGYALVALLDPRAARAGEAPRHFARLRGPQFGLGIVGLALLLAAAARII